MTSAFSWQNSISLCYFCLKCIFPSCHGYCGMSLSALHPLPTTQEKTLHMDINTKIRLIIIFAGKDGEALYSQQKQDQELTVAQIMNTLLPTSDSN